MTRLVLLRSQRGFALCDASGNTGQSQHHQSIDREAVVLRHMIVRLTAARKATHASASLHL